jgi:prepilin-type processing-associated H-X9-DG protein
LARWKAAIKFGIAINSILIWTYNTVARHAYTNMAQVASPALIYMLMDSGSFQAYPSLGKTSGADTNYLPGMGDLGVGAGTVTARYLPDFQSGRHFSGLTVAFADGHVKWLKAETIQAEAKKMNDAGWAFGQSPGVGYPAMAVRSAWNPFVDNS